MRAKRAFVVMALVAVSLGGAAEAQLSRRVALEWPAVDGEGLASLRLGLDEAQAPGLFGAPDTWPPRP